MSSEVSDLYQELVITITMVWKVKMESQDDEVNAQDDSGADRSLSDTVHNECCKPLSGEYPTSVPCVMSDAVKSADLKLSSGREELIEALKSDT